MCPIKPWSCDACAAQETQKLIDNFPGVVITNVEQFRVVANQLWVQGLVGMLHCPQPLSPWCKRQEAGWDFLYMGCSTTELNSFAEVPMLQCLLNLQIPQRLWLSKPATVNRRGEVVPEEWYFQCPTPCGEYTCEQCLRNFKKHCAMYAEAGVEASSFVIQAINAFGYLQSNIDDNFTVTIAVCTQMSACPCLPGSFIIMSLVLQHTGRRIPNGRV